MPSKVSQAVPVLEMKPGKREGQVILFWRTGNFFCLANSYVQLNIVFIEKLCELWTLFALAAELLTTEKYKLYQTNPC